MTKEYKLVIETDSSSDEVNNSSGGGSSEMTNSPSKFIKTVAKAYANTNMIRVAAHTGISLVSTYTGNQQLQNRIETSVGLAEQAISTAIMFGISPVAGAVTLGTQLIGLAGEVVQNQNQRSIQRMEVQQIRERSGPSFNRSRTTGEFF